MAAALPQVLNTYLHPMLDSTHWQQHYQPRNDDIIISTSIKSGTTWMLAIVVILIFQGKDVPSPPMVAPWLDMRHPRLTEEILAISWRRNSTGGSSRATWRSTDYLTTSRSNTSSSPGTLETSSCRCITTTATTPKMSFRQSMLIGMAIGFQRARMTFGCSGATGSPRAGSSGRARGTRTGGTCITPGPGGSTVTPEHLARALQRPATRPRGGDRAGG